MPAIPWTEVHLDLIGPWQYHVNGLKVSVRAMTIMDPVTNLVEIARVYTTKAEESTRVFLNTWISRYPLAEKVVTDNGPEFNGHEWEFMLMDWDLKRTRISTRTPTSNSVIESSHKAMGQILRTIFDREKPKTMDEMDKVIESAIASTMRALRCAANSSLQGLAPASLVFGRDMNLNIPIVTDIVAISHNRQLQTNLRLERENRRRTRHEYEVGQQVYVNNHHSTSDKLKPAWKGPYPVLQVHANGTLTIQRGQIHERISIRHLKPSV